MEQNDREQQRRIWAAEAIGWTYVPAGSLIEKPLKWMKLVCGYCHGVLTVTERYQWHKHEWATGSGEADCYGGKWKLFNSVWLKDGQVNSSAPDPEHNPADALALVDSIKDLDSASMLKSHGEWTVWLFTKDEMGFGPSHEEMEEGGFKATDPDFCKAVTLAFLKLHGKIT